MSDLDFFSTAVRLCRAMEAGAQIDGVEVVGRIQLTEDTCHLIRILAEQGKVDDLAISGVSVDPRNPDENASDYADISWTMPVSRRDGEAFGVTLGCLLNEENWRFECPARLYVWDLDVLLDNPSDPGWDSSSFREYAAVVRFTKLLAGLCEIRVGDTLKFLEPDRLDIKILYGESELNSVHLTCVRQLELELAPREEDPHVARRREIFIGQIENAVRTTATSAKFAHILDQLDDIYRRYRRDYNLYAKRFTHEQAVLELDSKKSEYIRKLNDAIQSISTKLLSVPLAYIIIGGQLSPTGGLQNDIIMIGATIFVVLMVLLVGNQILTVHHVQQDIAETRRRFKERVESDSLYKPIQQLTWRARSERVVLWGVILIIVSVWLLCFVLYMSYKNVA